MADRDLGLQFFDAAPGFRSPPSGALQQGTLFQQPKPTAEHRWPKGYSPERSRAMDEMVTVHGPERPMAGVPHTRERIEDAVKRSSMPVPSEPVKVRANMSPQKHDYAGLYHADWKTAEVFPRTGTTSANLDMTTLHELGHHESSSRGNESALNYRRYNPESVGREEAFADDWMVQHYRPRRNEPGADVRQHNPYESRSAFEGLTDQPGIAHGAYMGARTTLPARPAMASGRAQPWQERLYQRGANLVNTETEKDYGQWELYHGPAGAEPLDTIKIGRGVPPREKRMQSGIPRELTPDVIDENREVPDYKGLGARHGMSSMDAFQRYGAASGVETAVQDWKAGKLRR